MRSSRPIIALVCWCSLVAPAAATAADLVPGWDTAVRWDSNVLNSSEDEEADFVIRTGPLLELRQRQGDVTGRLRWRTLWEGFLDTDGANNFEHFVDLDAGWQMDARNELQLSNRFARTDSVTAQLATDGGTILAPGQGVEAGTTSVLQNRASAAFSHDFSGSLALQAAVDSSLLEFEDEGRSDSISTRGSLQLTRAISERTRLSIGAAFTRQDFDGIEGREDTGADIIELFGVWNYQITPTLSMSTSLGPALNRPDELGSTRLAPEVPVLAGALVAAAGSCPVRSDGSRVFASSCAPAFGEDLATGGLLPFVQLASGSIPLVEASLLNGDASSDDTVTFFGSWSLVKQWERTTARLSFQRTTSAASGEGVSTDLTTASASVSWQPQRKWRLSGTAGWALQTSASELPFTELVVAPATLFVDAANRLVDDPALAVTRVDGAAVTTGIRENGSTDNALETTTYQRDA